MHNRRFSNNFMEKKIMKNKLRIKINEIIFRLLINVN